MIVIGIGNKARHGKDTAASAILNHAADFGYATLKMSWADALYQEVNDFLAITKLFDKDRPTINTKYWIGVKEVRNGEVCIDKIPAWVTPTPNAEVNERSPYGKHAKILQWWGTEFRRTQDPNYWVKKGIEKIKAFEKENPYSVVVVPDTRFLNEATAIKDLGGETINVTRLVYADMKYADPSRDRFHRSETELDSYHWDFHIVAGNGQQALVGEMAITIFEYIRGLRGL